MRKIKLFIVHERYIDDSYGGNTEISLGIGVSEWNEVTDKDFEFIKSNLYRLQGNANSVVIVEQIDDAQTIISDIKSTILKIQKQEEKRLELQRQKREEAAANKAAKRLEKDRKALEKLIQSNPDLVRELVK